MKLVKALTPLEISDCFNIYDGNASNKITSKKRFLSLTGLTPLKIRRQRRVTVAYGNLSLTGLTLVELLIASAIIVVVMVTIYSAFHSGIFGYRNIEETLDVYQTARSILGRINLDLRNSFAYSEDETKFVGEKNKISFLTLVDTYRQDKIVQDYAFVFYKFEGDNKLLRLCRKNQEALKEDSEIQPEEMADNVEKLNFTYFYFDTADSKLKERDSWDEPKNLPVAVKVSLTIKAKIEQKFERTIYLPLAKVK